MRTALLLLDFDTIDGLNPETEDYAETERYSRLADLPDYYSELDWDDES